MSEVKKIIELILQSEKCGDLFEKSEDDVKTKFRQYSKTIHPDICNDPRAKGATIHLNHLYESALEHLAKGTWDKTGSVYIAPKLMMGTVQDISAFELGGRYINPTTVIYVFDSLKKVFFDNYLESLNWIHFGDDKMKKLYSSLVPHVKISNPRITMDRSYIAISKEPNEYPFDLFLKAYGNQLTGRDIAWMISRMIDLCCFLHYNSIALNGFTESNLFVNPDDHSMHIYGGWWYCRKIGEKMIGTSKNIYSVMTNKTKTNKTSEIITDIESVRMISERLITNGQNIPEAIRNWVNSGSMDHPIKEYERWNVALDKAYGARKFTKFEAKPEDIYTQRSKRD